MDSTDDKAYFAATLRQMIDRIAADIYPNANLTVGAGIISLPLDADALRHLLAHYTG